MTGKDITGQRFGRLVAVFPCGIAKGGYRLWKCKCDCGNEKVCSTKYLGKGTSSCGCLRKESERERFKTHGKRYTRLYNVHRSILQRCTNPNAHEYNNYGGRGVTICDEWLNFEAFEKWALDNGYDENAPQGTCTLDRIDTDKGYCPENCRFVDMKVQQRNRRNNRMLTYNGETHCMAEWAEIAGVKYGTFVHRINAGWSMSDALNR